MHLLWWVEQNLVRGVINMYLDLHSAATRSRQLIAASDWFRCFRSRMADRGLAEGIFVFGGDRNFTSAPEHRLSSSTSGTWYPGAATMQAWASFMASIGDGHVLEQPEFTWSRIQDRQDATYWYCRKILDVSGLVIDPLKHVNWRPESKVVPNMPFPHASDHCPIDLCFKPTNPLRPKRQQGAPRIPYIPDWLFECDDFMKDLSETVGAWKASRSRGLQGIEEFNEALAVSAKDYLKTHAY